jgi:hypothetical protein
MSDNAPGPDRTTAAQIRDALEALERQAFDELGRLGARVFKDAVTGKPRSHHQHALLYKSMASGWPGVEEHRNELSHMSDEALVSAAYLCEILSYVHWARTCLATGGDIWHLFALTLERLSAVPINDLVAAWKQAGSQKRGGKASPKRKAAVVKLLEKILREDDELQAKDLWSLAGSSMHERYCHVELDGDDYEFLKDSDRNLGIFRVDPELGRQRLRSQSFNSTFRRWCKEAQDNLSSPPA